MKALNKGKFKLFLKKVEEKFGSFKNSPYLCTRNSEMRCFEAP